MIETTSAAPSAKEIPGDWVSGIALTLAGSRRYGLFVPEGIAPGERRPLMVMLHGCHQDAAGFAASTGMNALAARHRFLVLYPEQSSLCNPNGCWNWFCTASGRAYAEVEIIANAIDQVCRLYGVDAGRIVIGGMSAGASMAALVATRHPELFRAVMMHSGVPPGTASCGLSALDAMRGHAPTSPIEGYAGLRKALPPLLVIHGTEDAIVSLANSRAAAGAWAATATLVEIEGLGHAWSGGSADEPYGDAAGPDASSMMWRFARQATRAPAA